jgi:hypothetical protein
MTDPPTSNPAARILEILTRYGRHDETCPLGKPHPAWGSDAPATPRRCSCGFEGVLRKLRKERDGGESAL